jgi:hypothetical protein
MTTRRKQRPYIDGAPEWDNWVETVDRLIDKWLLLLDHTQSRGGIATLMQDWPEAHKRAFARQADAFGYQWKQLACAIYATYETVEIDHERLAQ